MDNVAQSAPILQDNFGEVFYTSIKSTKNQGEYPEIPVTPLGVAGISASTLDSIVLSSNTTRDKLLLQNKYKLNRQLKDALCVNGVVTKKVVRNCLKSSISKEAEVEIHLPKNGAAIIKNVMTCKNFWQCPVCRTNMLKQKRKNIQSVVNKSKTQNLMVTLTLRHSREDSLEKLVDGLQKASSDMWRDRVWQKLKKQYKFDWHIRNLEITWGVRNGWHIHMHILIGSLSKELDIGDIEEKLFQVWNRLVLKYKMKQLDRQAGVNAILAENASAYLAKWNYSNEMAGQKSGRGDNVSIGDLEVDVLGYTINPEYKGYTSLEQTRYLLKEYHEGFENRRFLYPGGRYNEILKEVEEAQELKDEDEEVIEDTTVVFVKSNFWMKLSYAGYSMDFVSILETRSIPSALDWLSSKWKNTGEILDNVRVVEHIKDSVNATESVSATALSG